MQQYQLYLSYITLCPSTYALVLTTGNLYLLTTFLQSPPSLDSPLLEIKNSLISFPASISLLFVVVVVVLRLHI